LAWYWSASGSALHPTGPDHADCELTAVTASTASQGAARRPRKASHVSALRCTGLIVNLPTALKTGVDRTLDRAEAVDQALACEGIDDVQTMETMETVAGREIAQPDAGGRSMKLSVVVPAKDEADTIVETLTNAADALEAAGIEYELLVVDDASTDDTAAVLMAAQEQNHRIRYLRSEYPSGFGLTVRHGLERFEGDAVCVMMADGSDAPEDLVTYYRLLEDGYDCAFGSRFIRGGSITDYPRLKLALNRFANGFIRLVFHHGYNDTTNAFKAYRREVIETVQPLLSNHFNLTVELPLKAIVRGHSYAIVPISWRNRQRGISKLKIEEMGSRYLFIVLYVFLEDHLTRGDYRRPGSTRRRLRPALHTTSRRDKQTGS
jgi:glycosyltransferase involved in cell wall biosynthesis